MSPSLVGKESQRLSTDRTIVSYYPCCPFDFIFQPKIIWLKNKMDIQGDPKYRALTNLGICSLEIRKPGPFDGGIYTCKAVNSLGEASVDCRVDVKGKGRIHALRCVISSLQRWKSQGRDTSLDGEGFGLIPISGPLITVIIRMYLRSHFYFPLSHFFLSILILEYRKNCYLYFAKEEPEAQGGR